MKLTAATWTWTRRTEILRCARRADESGRRGSGCAALLGSGFRDRFRVGVLTTHHAREVHVGQRADGFLPEHKFVE
jgi:hypothetical protein